MIFKKTNQRLNLPALLMCLLLSALVLCCLASLAGARPLAYVVHSLSNTVSVLDLGRGRVVKEIPVGKEPFGLAFSPDGQRAYVANAQSKEISVIDVSRHELLRNIATGSELPAWVAVSSDGSYIYVTHERGNDVAVIAAGSSAVVRRIPVGRGPAGIVVSHDSRFAYVANEGSHEVWLLDLQREVAINKVSVGMVPQGLAMSPDGVWLYVANFGSNSVSVVATGRNRVEAEIPVGRGPVGIAASPDGRFVYTANFRSASLSVVDVAQRKQIANIPVGEKALGVAVGPDGRYIYIANSKDRQLSVIGADQLAVMQRINLEQRPFKVAVLPETHFRLQIRHLCMTLFVVALGFLLIHATRTPHFQKTSESTPVQTQGSAPDSSTCSEMTDREALLEASSSKERWILTATLVLALGLRVVGLNWGIPVFDADTAKTAPDLRVSFHLDEDNFLWNLSRVRPEKFDFFVADFHWGTLQYHLLEVALLLAEFLGVVSSPWRESFLNFHPTEYARIFAVGRTVSAVLGSLSIFAAYAIGKRLYGKGAAILSALIVSVLPVHVVNSHYLTSDVTMVFFLLLAFFALILSFEFPSPKRHGLAGLAAGLAVTAKYNALAFVGAVLILHIVSRMAGWKKKIWFYVGFCSGFVIGEPYALIYPWQFAESVAPYVRIGDFPEGAVPSFGALLSLQIKNMAVFGLGLPLSIALLALIVRFVRTSGRLLRSRGCDRKQIFSYYFQPPKGPRRLILGLTISCFVLSTLPLRQPLIRYALPATVFLVFPAADFLFKLSYKLWGRGLVIATLFLTGLLSLLQVRILTQTHTVNEAFQWIERHVPAGASIKKGWPEIPVLNPAKFRITNFFVQKDLADFRKYFLNENEEVEFPDYVVLDGLSTLETPPEFWETLERNYNVVAKFERMPQIGGTDLPEWDPPHDWRYTHPFIWIYRKRM